MYGGDGHRGSIKYIDRYKQLISYEGMERRRKITPTDIDGFIDYSGKVFVYLECKLEGKGMDYGQRFAFENIINSHNKAGNLAIAILFVHNCKPDEIIIAKDKQAIGFYTGKGWKNIESEVKTVLDVIIEWEKYCEKKGIIL